MPGITIVAGLVIASLSTPAAPARNSAPAKKSAYGKVQFSAPRSQPKSNVRMVCGMPMLIGDASVDPGILFPAKRNNASKPESGKEEPSCGGIHLVKPARLAGVQ